jgi:hypothetical protein
MIDVEEADAIGRFVDGIQPSAIRMQDEVAGTVRLANEFRRGKLARFVV